MPPLLDPELQDILPLHAHVDDEGCLVLGGVSVAELVGRFGTPLYVYDEQTTRTACRAYLKAFPAEGSGTSVYYASKAYLATWLCRMIEAEGLGLDVVSRGELYVAQAAGFPTSRIRLHGSNKLLDELRHAVDAGIGCIVVDNHEELQMLSTVAQEAGRSVQILLRLSPDVDSRVHRHLNTGVLESKFGLPISTGDALQAVRSALSSPMLDLLGYHVHIGTTIYETLHLEVAIRRVVEFARIARTETGFWPREVSPGGGLGIAYLPSDRPPSVGDFAHAIARGSKEADPSPKVSVEPGRSIVGRAGVALYRVGVRKRISGVRTYVSVDGGMADNIRPALYDSRYTALAATRMTEPYTESVTVAGRYCESGDILVRDAKLPNVVSGDVLALPASGAYCLAMSSQYNAALRPAVVVVNEGTAHLVQRRGTPSDLLAYDAG